MQVGALLARNAVQADFASIISGFSDLSLISTSSSQYTLGIPHLLFDADTKYSYIRGTQSKG